jgi:hypothetical protein
MKTLALLLTFIAISTNLLSAEPQKGIEAFQGAIQTAASERDKTALLKFFNFAGINTATQKTIEKEIEDILSSRILDVSVEPLDRQNQEMARENPEGVNGTPEYLVSIVPTNDRHALHFVAGSTAGGIQILLTNREE